MTVFLILLCAAGVFLFASGLAADASRPGGPRPFGLAFLLAVMLSAFGGWSVNSLQRIEEPLAGSALVMDETNTAPNPSAPPNVSFDPTRPTRRGIPADGLLFLLTGALYALSAIRGKQQQPAWIADILLIAASCGALAVFASLRRAYYPSAPAGPFFGMATPQFLLSLFWMWAIARLTAALNRVPQVTGGYLGIVALLVLLLLHNVGTTLSFFPYAAVAALAGAGLATVPVALKKPAFNLGWSAALASGFLLAQGVVFGLPHFTWQTTIALAFLIFALPLLDVLFYRVKPRPEQKVTGISPRLHEGLMMRGFSPTKVAVLYTAVGCWLALLGYMMSRFALSGSYSMASTLMRLLSLLLIGAGGALLFLSVARVLMRRAPGEVVPESVEAFGAKVSAVTMEEALEKIKGFIHSRTPHHVLTCDANAILRAKEDPEYAAIMKRAAMVTPDGYGVIWGLRLLGYPIYERVTGVDMVTGICELAAQEGYSIYILGSEPGENGQPSITEIAAKNLMARYPGLRVAGTHHGFWRREAQAQGISIEEADARMAEIVRAAKPDILFVAMGIPIQEKFIGAHMEQMQVPVSLGVGGSFDVYSGKFNRAPIWMQRIGLEWLYRVIIDPSRWKRMGYIPRFMLLAIKVWLTGNPGKVA